MRILCIDQFVSLGGGQRSLLDLLPAFVERGWSSSVAVPADGPLAEAVRKLGVSVHYLPYGDYSSGTKLIHEQFQYAAQLPHVSKRLARLVRELEINLLYVNGPRMMPPAAFASKVTGAPLVYHCHNRLHQRTAIKLTGWSIAVARARMIACCEHVAVPLRKYVEPGTLSVIYNGVAAAAPHRLQTSSRLRRIGVVGRIEPEKGQLEFVKAARKVASTFPDCEFALVGAPLFSDDRYFKRVVEAAEGLELRVSGWRNDPSTVFSDIDLLVVPSTPIEATTRVILESYSAGIPVVAFPSGGIPEIVRDGATGFLAADGTPEALARRIISVLRMDHDQVASVVDRAQRVWSEQFTLPAYRRAVCHVIANAAAQRLNTQLRDEPAAV